MTSSSSFNVVVLPGQMVPYPSTLARLLVPWALQPAQALKVDVINKGWFVFLFVFKDV